MSNHGLFLRGKDGPRGEMALLYSDELYQAFRSALLIPGNQLVADGQGHDPFPQAQKMRLERNKAPKVGHWIKFSEPDYFAQNGTPGAPPDIVTYEATVKFVLPIAKPALKECIAKFKDEFGIVDPRKSYPKIVGIEARRGGTEQEVIIKMPESEFKKIQGKVLENSRARV